MKENFKNLAQLPGLENFYDYEISNMGYVISYKRKNPLLRKTRIGSRGYPQLMLTNKKEYKVVEIHRLVALAFVEGYEEGLIVCHEDGNPLNCQESNLRWDTRSSNELDKRKHGVSFNFNKTHCPLGHEYIERNLLSYPLNKRGERSCKSCDRARLFIRNHPDSNYDFQVISDLCFMYDCSVNFLIKNKLIEKRH